MNELNIIETSRQQKRKLGRDTLKNKINQQYSYTTREAISTFKDLRGGDLTWLPSKEGQTIEQWWEDRISQQRSAQTLTKAKPLGCFGVHSNNDTKLDDKIREFICNTNLHQEIEFENDGAGREWVLTRVDDIYKKLDFNPNSVDDIFNNEQFMKLWFKRLELSKTNYFKNLENLSKVYNLKKWQELVVRQMIVSAKKYHVLGLAPRFGKTLTILHSYKQKVISGEYSNEELWLVPASKSLSSNTSFVNDYTDFGFSDYFKIVKDVSLFVDDDKVIERLRKKLPLNSKIVLITDEGDLASHTLISVDKLNLVKKSFNVVEQVVMTGTGIGKATKILKGIPINDINYQDFTYSQMVSMGGNVVKRNFVNIQYDITKDFGTDEVLNIRQSVNDTINHPQLAKYIGDWTINSVMEKRFNLQPTEIVMVFIKPKENKYLKQLVEVYEIMYSDKVKCIVLTGSEGANNRTAENKVKKTYNDMRKVGDMRKLIVFSAGIGSRSFSVPKIYREINFSDAELTSATIQEFARVYTYEEGKKVADIIRIGFTPMNLAEEIYLHEHEVPSYDERSNEKIRMFLMNSTFSNILISEDGNPKWEKVIGNNIEDVGKFLDSVCKFTDNTSYIMTRISTEGLVVDTDAAKVSSKTKTNVVSTTPQVGKKIKTTQTKNGKLKFTAEDERKLRQYINICRCIPAIASIHGIQTITEFFKSGYWDVYLDINQTTFQENYNTSDEFKGIVDGLFRQNIERSIGENKQRLEEYMKFIS
jgi:hypothetical protein